MPRVSEDDFPPDVTLETVFATPSLDAAERAEGILDAQGLSYVIDVEMMVRGQWMAVTPVKTAVFWVRTEEAADCRSALRRAGLAIGIIDAPA